AFARAFAKSQLGGGTILPQEGCVFVSVRDADKTWILEPVRLLAAHGFRILATSGTASYLASEAIRVEVVKKVLEGRPHIVDASGRTRPSRSELRSSTRASKLFVDRGSFGAHPPFIVRLRPALKDAPAAFLRVRPRRSMRRQSQSGEGL